MQTSYGQQLCRRFIQSITASPFIENCRPSWLGGLEADFLFEAERVVIEFNGDQHYFKTSMSACPLQQIFRDRRKKVICRERGFRLLIIQACDLEYTRMRGKLKKTGLSLSPPRKGRRKPKALQKLAVEYRKTLVARFNSPTACRKGSKKREAMKARINAPAPPVSASSEIKTI